ncbi:MAG TPA: hypothetical protein VMS17_30955 [Gemmataceae bacterium]|nr:hypothetical protein [Gemmataceae bacterium]
MTTPRYAVLAVGLFCAPPLLAAAVTDAAAGPAAAVLKRYCWECHDGKPDQLKGGLAIRDLGSLRKRHVIPENKGRADPLSSELYQLVLCGSMPPGDRPKPSPEDVQRIGDWIAAGAPDFPPESGEIYVSTKIAQDLLKQRTLHPDDVRYQRYISFNHLHPAAPDLWKAALDKTLNHLSWEPKPVQVVPIDPPNNTIFRFDERDAGWDLKPFNVADGGDLKSVDLFDLLLLEYPYATYPTRLEGDAETIALYLQQAGLVRPILYLRGDWFVRTATQPPLYEDLLRLPRRLTAKDGLEDKIQTGGQPARAGLLHSVMSGGPQLVERRDDAPGSGGLGAYWRTFDLGAVKDMKGLLHAPDADRGGLMLFTLPNGLNGYYIAESVALKNGKRLVRLADSAPAEWVVDPKAPDRIARNGLSCMRCHENGVESFAEAARSAIDGLPADERSKLQPLFPGKDAMDKFITADAARFQNAVAAIHNGPFRPEPLGPLTSAAPASPAVTPVGLISGGAERRNLIPPPAGNLDAPALPPLDGLTVPEYPDPDKPPLVAPSLHVTMAPVNGDTKKETDTFLPGDKFALEVKNEGDRDVYFELIFASINGRMVIHQPQRKLAAGQVYHYPADRPKEWLTAPPPYFTMQLPAGVDRYILFASDAEFPPGVLLQAKDVSIGDRVVHRFWSNPKDGGKPFDPSHIIKKTLQVKTQEP